MDMTDHRIEAIYEYLSAIPRLEGSPDPTGYLHNDCGDPHAQPRSSGPILAARMPRLKLGRRKSALALRRFRHHVAGLRRQSRALQLHRHMSD